MASRAQSARPSVRNAWSEQFTLTNETPSLSHSAHVAVSRHDSTRTHRSMSATRPSSSASGMNAPGGSSPRSGCSHRTSDSNPATAPVAKSTMGW